MIDLRKWLEAHPCFNFRSLEREAKLPKRTLYHFMTKGAGQRDLNDANYKNLIAVLEKYGFVK